MAEPAAPPVSLQRLRNTLALHVEEKSLRRVANALTLSPTGLTQFLDGAVPYRPVRAKLHRWWKEHGHRPLEPVSPEQAQAAVDDLLGPLPAAEAERLKRRLLEIVAAAHDAAELPPPGWLATLAGDGTAADG